ncbi:ROK family transcriptional regulator [Sphingobium sufflavum]|uniref:ROK family protein n=1 Tax=Sphingobium sufflavum TaxID=1129547 RepID=UPI001F3CB0CF|nr:ROK family transcriptional regulator [Sphingobium sufflavum]MCE7797143.1 ROK family transcriptional regulator [Sphingobium sufflavum]
MRGIDAARTRLAVLKMIRRAGPISRVELARVTNLGGATITKVTSDMVARNLLLEERRPLKSLGRPHVLLSINPRSAAVIGVYVGHKGGLEVSLVDLGGNLLVHHSYELEHYSRIADLTHKIAVHLRHFIAVRPAHSPEIVSIALALPGTIESPDGIVHWVPTMEQTITPVGAMLSGLLDLPVTVENDVECLARAENWFGDDSLDDFTIVEVGTNLGAADYVDGVTRYGANGFSAEFAHVKAQTGDGARACFCGGRGCLTSYASTGGILRTGQSDPDRLNLDLGQIETAFLALTAAAAEGEADALAAFDKAGRYLGVALSNLINMRDPGIVLIRCITPEVADLLKGPLMETLQEHCLSTILSRTTIDVGVAMEGWRWRGAAALALEQTYLGGGIQPGGAQAS